MSVNSSSGAARKPSANPAVTSLQQQTVKQTVSIASSRQPQKNNGAPQQTAQIQNVDPGIFDGMKRELEEIRQQLSESDDVISGLEKERDFYFTKLRKIEVVCQDDEAAGVIQVPKLLQVKLFKFF